jgi:predicted nucleic acid-binding protein
MRVVAVDEAIGKLAGELRARHYHRRTAPISLADCIALAASSVLGGTLATSDPALAAVARRVGVKVLGLPNSAGSRP